MTEPRPGTLGELNALGFKPHLDALRFEYGLDRRGHFRVLAGQKPGLFLDHRDFAAKTSIHLRELKADVAPADDKQMPRQLLEFEKRCA